MTGRPRTASSPASAASPLPDGHEQSSVEPTAPTLARIEKTLTDVQHTLAIQFQRFADMQAELDKLSTTVRDHLGQPHAAAVKPAAGPGGEPRHSRTGS